MKTEWLVVGAFVALAQAQGALAQVTVKDAWVRGTVPAQKATGAFMKLESKGEAKLVSVSTPAAKTVEIHEMSMTDGVMMMREIGSLALPAGKSVELKPGGYHVMLFDLAKPLSKGQTVPLTLVVQDSSGARTTIAVSATVKALGE